jgi:hypothetical protein
MTDKATATTNTDASNTTTPVPKPDLEGKRLEVWGLDEDHFYYWDRKVGELLIDLPTLERQARRITTGANVHAINESLHRLRTAAYYLSQGKMIKEYQVFAALMRLNDCGVKSGWRL